MKKPKIIVRFYGEESNGRIWGYMVDWCRPVMIGISR